MGRSHRLRALRRSRRENDVASTCVRTPMTVRAYLGETGVQTPLVPVDAGTQALPQKLGSRFRGNERGWATQSSHALLLCLQRQTDRLPGRDRALDGDGGFQVDAGLL